MGVIAITKRRFGDCLRTAKTFGHVLAGHFKMHTAAIGAFDLVNFKEP